MAYDPINQLAVVYAGATSAGSLYDVWTLRLQAAGTANPVPAITSISPGTTTAGSPSFTLTVTGSNFSASSVVRWNGVARPTSYVRSTQLQASIPASDIASAATAQVTVTNPSPGGGSSTSLAFAVTPNNPAPTLTSITPNQRTQGTTVPVTVTGRVVPCVL